MTLHQRARPTTHQPWPRWLITTTWTLAAAYALAVWAACYWIWTTLR